MVRMFRDGWDDDDSWEQVDIGRNPAEDDFDGYALQGYGL